MSDDRTRIAGKSSTIRIGTELNQTYKVDALLGAGGMGEVFKGHNIQTGDPVAIKIVLPEFAHDEMIFELFRKEARILNHLSHDAIVRYYVFSIDGTIGRPYLAMEYVDGPSLAERVKTQPLTEQDFSLLLMRLADGLSKAHHAGVIHRDMSPDNVILPNGLVNNAKIIDFGIARSANVGGATLLGGSFAGKYNYVSPEQLGLFGGEVTPQSDIYSLALVMAAAMRGKPLDMSGSQVDVIEKRRKVPDLHDIPKALRGVLEAMLQPDPAKRPATMADVRDWVESIVSPGPKGKKAHPQADSGQADNDGTGDGHPLQFESPQRSKGLRNAAIAAAFLVVIGVGILGGWLFVNSTSPVMQSNGGPQTTNDTQTGASGGNQSAQVPALASGDTAPAPPKEQTETQPAQETSAPTLPAGNQEGKAAKVTSLEKLIKDFGDGKCFLANVDTLTESTAKISVISTQDIATSFRQKFAEAAGFVPAITTHTAMEDQCAVIHAIAQMKPSASPLSVSLSANEIRADNLVKEIPGEPIAFDFANVGDRNIYVFLIDHAGNVTNISRARPDLLTLKPGQLHGKLNAGWPDEQDPGSKEPFLPMIILAIASPKPLLKVNAQVMFDGETFVTEALPELAAAANVSVSAGYFKLMPP